MTTSVAFPPDGSSPYFMNCNKHPFPTGPGRACDYARKEIRNNKLKYKDENNSIRTKFMRTPD